MWPDQTPDGLPADPLSPVRWHIQRLRDEVAYLMSGGDEVDDVLSEVVRVAALKRGCRRG